MQYCKLYRKMKDEAKEKTIILMSAVDITENVRQKIADHSLTDLIHKSVSRIIPATLSVYNGKSNCNCSKFSFFTVNGKHAAMIIYDAVTYT